jgi:hypothetical protein
MDKFSAKDICAIIKTCSQSNVVEISVGGLKVCFGPEGVGEKATPLASDLGLTPTIPEPSFGPPSEGRLLSQEEREVIEELQNSQLMFDDPEAYEQQQIDKFMGNGAALDG